MTVRGRVEQLLDEVTPLAPDPTLIGSLRAQLANPLTVALVGRVSAGKSTLLNALVGDRVAPTDRAECTKVAALYTEGSPQRVEVVGLDGTVTEIPGTMRGDLGRTPEDIDHAVVYTPSRLLRERFRVIDTPGLSGFTDTAEIATRRVFSGEGRLPRPDVVLFLLDDAAGPKADEVQFLSEAGASAQNTILVISHADLIAADNPMLKAQEIARRVWRRFPAIAGAVVAVSGLMAEAGVCGVTERETAQISRRGLLESWELLTILDGAAPPPPGLDVDLLGDAGYPTYLLGTWVREKQAITLEEGVRKLTSDPADLFGLKDRGRLTKGAPADVAIFDPERIGSKNHGERRYDLPGGAKRIVMPSQGVEYTIVNGALTWEQGKLTEAKAGTVLRG